jgi:flagellar hook-length control protein FliK
MPKILASMPDPKLSVRPSGAANTSGFPATGNKSNRISSFEDALSGVRRREPAPESKTAGVEKSNKANAKKDAAAKSDADQAEIDDSNSELDADQVRENAKTESKNPVAKKEKSRKSEEAATDIEAEGETEAQATTSASELPEQEIPVDAPVLTDETADPEPTDKPAAEAKLVVSDQAAMLAAATIPAAADDVDLAADAEASGASDIVQLNSGTTASTTNAAKATTGVPISQSSVVEETAVPTDDIPPELSLEDADAAKSQAQAPALEEAEAVENLELPDAAGTTDANPAKHVASDEAMKSLEQFALPELPKQVQTQATNTTAAPSVAPEVQFAEDNHPTIVSGVRGQLLPTGGTMQIRLDPPELGPLAVTVRIHDGMIEASFETSNEQATKLLSHSLSSLKTSLESHGVNVERLQVQQAPKDQPAGQSGSDRDSQQGQHGDTAQEHTARQEQQRKEMIRRMWQRLTGTEDPLDMVA